MLSNLYFLVMKCATIRCSFIKKLLYSSLVHLNKLCHIYNMMDKIYSSNGCFDIVQSSEPNDLIM